MSVAAQPFAAGATALTGRGLSSNVMPLMKLSALGQYLHGHLSIAELVSALDVAHYERALSKRGASVHVKVEEDADLAIERPEIIFLCSEFIAGRLTQVQLAYIADGLQLSERASFSEEWVADAVAEFTDPEINEAFTVERANEIVRVQGPNNSLQGRRP